MDDSNTSSIVGNFTNSFSCDSAQKEIRDWAKIVWRVEDLPENQGEECKKGETPGRKDRGVDLEQDYELIIEQMKREAEEFKADAERMSRVLASVNLPSGLSDSALVCAQTLEKSAEILDVLTPDRTNLMLGMGDLQQKLEESEEMLESSQKRAEKYRVELPEILKRKEKWQRELSRLDSNLANEEQEMNKMSKSTFYMTKKKKQYELEIQRYEQCLKTLGFNDSLSHEELVRLGSEVSEMEEQLKPLRLQLNSYQDLPPDMSQALVKLESRRLEYKKLEDAVAKKLGAISFMERESNT